MVDIAKHLEAISRSTGRRRIPAGDGRTVVLRRTYPAAVEDVWDAITDPERIRRWFLPVTGDLRLGGRYQLKGNAGGEILRCEPPHLLAVTWVYGDNPGEADVSEVEVRLSATGDGGTELVLDHAAVVDDERWGEYGPGAVGVGWDLTLLGLGLHLTDDMMDDPLAWTMSPEGREFAIGSSAAWGAALRETGAGGDEVDRAVRNTTEFYAPTVGE